MTNFEIALKKVLGIEGGYVNNPNDPGGKTNYGITEGLAKKYGYDISSLTKENAIEIYRKEFWEKPHFNLIEDTNIATELFEFGVNAGSKIAVKVLQRAFNLFHKDNLLKEDGILGKITAGKINNYKHPKSLYSAMNILQGMYYIGLAEGDSLVIENIKSHETKEGTKLKTFIRGWIDKRVKTSYKYDLKDL
jgi:lysozyme family protein